MSVFAELFHGHVIAEVSGLVKIGRSLTVVFLFSAGIAFLVTRRGWSGVKKTGPANYAGGMYIVYLYLRWVFLFVGLIGVLLLIIGILIK
ncbi:MAG: hypothetical protein M1420_02840 [Actinobacteria bacterium]|jgi:hypothetical protein|nr:hypothetical protein [Actinomycetota bacterium]